MANRSSVATVGIVVIVLVALFGGYLMYRDSGDSNDIRIDLPGGKK